jgi:formylglycine-generating enzyme required for sulfatase activity
MKTIVHGGGWVNYPQFCRAAFRGYYAPTSRYFNVGFRLTLAISL